MNIVQVRDVSKVKHLFDGYQDTLIRSCLDGTIGEIYAKDVDQPEAAMAILGDFSFYTGKPSEELVQYKPLNCETSFLIMVPQNEEWAKLIATCYGERATKIKRYAIAKEGDIFDRQKLEKVVASLSPQYSIKLLDEEIFDYTKDHRWCYDWCSQYKDYPTYQRLGLGVVICKDGIPVSGASSYTSYQGGIEIQIDTKPEFRRKGLAYCCAAKLILECLERALYPSWDAHNLWSVALAEKLGYHFDHEYIAFKVNGY